MSSVEEADSGDSGDNLPITRGEVTEAVKQLLGVQASALDEVQLEFLKNLDVVGLSCLTCLSIIMWKSWTVALD